MVTVNARNNESFDRMMKRFRNGVQREGVLTTVRKKRFFVSKSELRRKKRDKAIRKARQRQRENERRESYF